MELWDVLVFFELWVLENVLTRFDSEETFAAAVASRELVLELELLELLESELVELELLELELLLDVVEFCAILYIV